MLTIPPKKIESVSRGLEEAFGTTTIEDIRRMTQGLSSDLVFRIIVKGSPFVLRIMTRMDERNDPVRIFACMTAAADAGLAPRVWYTNAEDGISIIDFVEKKPFPETQALAALPCTLRKLHSLPPFPKAFNFATAQNRFIWKFLQTDLLPKDQIEEAFARYEQVCAVYPRTDSDMVSCHMDLKPENILFDGERLWLVDWQAAFVNDRYFDLAVAANFVAAGDADEREYLQRYFGQPPDEYQRARFFLMRQVLHMFYATVFLTLGSSGQPIHENENPPSFRNFHQRIWAGDVNLADNDSKIAYGLIHWRRLMENVPQPRFLEALGAVAARNEALADTEPLLPTAP